MPFSCRLRCIDHFGWTVPSEPYRPVKHWGDGVRSPPALLKLFGDRSADHAHHRHGGRQTAQIETISIAFVWPGRDGSSRNLRADPRREGAWGAERSEGFILWERWGGSRLPSVPSALRGLDARQSLRFRRDYRSVSDVWSATLVAGSRSRDRGMRCPNVPGQWCRPGHLPWRNSCDSAVCIHSEFRRGSNGAEFVDRP